MFRNVPSKKNVPGLSKSRATAGRPLQGSAGECKPGTKGVVSVPFLAKKKLVSLCYVPASFGQQYLYVDLGVGSFCEWLHNLVAMPCAHEQAYGTSEKTTMTFASEQNVQCTRMTNSEFNAALVIFHELSAAGMHAFCEWAVKALVRVLLPVDKSLPRSID